MNICGWICFQRDLKPLFSGLWSSQSQRVYSTEAHFKVSNTMMIVEKTVSWFKSVQVYWNQPAKSLLRGCELKLYNHVQVAALYGKSIGNTSKLPFLWTKETLSWRKIAHFTDNHTALLTMLCTQLQLFLECCSKTCISAAQTHSFSFLGSSLPLWSTCTTDVKKKKKNNRIFYI